MEVTAELKNRTESERMRRERDQGGRGDQRRREEGRGRETEENGKTLPIRMSHLVKINKKF